MAGVNPPSSAAGGTPGPGTRDAGKSGGPSARVQGPVHLPHAYRVRMLAAEFSGRDGNRLTVATWPGHDRWSRPPARRPRLAG